MTVKGADFSTAVNGQMVDSWSDGRLRAGGVGFFSDNGEVASLRYVQVTDKDTVVGRLLSYLGLLRPLSRQGYSFRHEIRNDVVSVEELVRSLALACSARRAVRPLRSGSRASGYAPMTSRDNSGRNVVS